MSKKQTFDIYQFLDNYRKDLLKRYGKNWKETYIPFDLLLHRVFYYIMISERSDGKSFIMAEMIFGAYVMGYIQVFLLGNFDEGESFGIREGLSSLLCSALYTVTSFILNWYDRNIMATAAFFFYMLFCYVCMFLVYKIKRDIDTELLNQELEEFKKRK